MWATWGAWSNPLKLNLENCRKPMLAPFQPDSKRIPSLQSDVHWPMQRYLNAATRRDGTGWRDDTIGQNNKTQRPESQAPKSCCRPCWPCWPLTWWSSAKHRREKSRESRESLGVQGSSTTCTNILRPWAVLVTYLGRCSHLMISPLGQLGQLGQGRRSSFAALASWCETKPVPWCGELPPHEHPRYPLDTPG